MSETAVMRRILLAVSRRATRMFRNNVGTAWIGRVHRLPGTTVQIEGARPLHAGLCKGSSDLIGWTSVEITPEHLGKRLAVFTAIETKEGNERATDEQLHFIQQVRAAGGYAGIARCDADALEIVEGRAL